MFTYRIVFNGYGANRVTYREQSISMRVRHNWNINAEEAANVMFLVHQNVKEHFTRYKIISVEMVY